MLRSILVPLDNSPFAEQALPLAASIARRADAVLQVAHVHETPPDDYVFLTDGGMLGARVKEYDAAYLDGVVKRLTNAGVKAEPVLLEGPPASALTVYAAAAGVGLAVLATHGRGALGRFWFGSIADDLTRHLPMPVLLVRPSDGAADLAPAPAFKRILAALDGSALAEQILEPALALGALTDAEYVLFRAVKPVVHPLYYPEVATLGVLVDEVAAVQGRATDAARAYLNDVADRLRARGLRVQTHVAVEEDPGAAILREARARSADLIALATHGRGGLARLFRGSVADKVVRAGSTPVLVYRPKEPPKK
jgi:nucleotide-binding universal stress UspA family protein